MHSCSHEWKPLAGDWNNLSVRKWLRWEGDGRTEEPREPLSGSLQTFKKPLVIFQDPLFFPSPPPSSGVSFTRWQPFVCEGKVLKGGGTDVELAGRRLAADCSLLGYFWRESINSRIRVVPIQYWYRILVRYQAKRQISDRIRLYVKSPKWVLQ